MEITVYREPGEFNPVLVMLECYHNGDKYMLNEPVYIKLENYDSELEVLKNNFKLDILKKF